MSTSPSAKRFCKDSIDFAESRLPTIPSTESSLPSMPFTNHLSSFANSTSSRSSITPDQLFLIAQTLSLEHNKAGKLGTDFFPVENVEIGFDLDDGQFQEVLEILTTEFGWLEEGSHFKIRLVDGKIVLTELPSELHETILTYFTTFISSDYNRKVPGSCSMPLGSLGSTRVRLGSHCSIEPDASYFNWLAPVGNGQKGNLIPVLVVEAQDKESLECMHAITQSYLRGGVKVVLNVKGFRGADNKLEELYCIIYYAEDHQGGQYPARVVVSFGPLCRASTLQRIQEVTGVQPTYIREGNSIIAGGIVQDTTGILTIPAAVLFSEVPLPLSQPELMKDLTFDLSTLVGLFKYLGLW